MGVLTPTEVRNVKCIVTAMMTLHEQVLVALLVEAKIDTYARKLTQKVINVVKKKSDDINKKRILRLTMKVPWPGFLKRRDSMDTPEIRMARSRLTGNHGPKPFGQDELVVKLSIGIDRKNDQDDAGINASWNPLLNELNIELVIFSKSGLITKQHFSMIQREAYGAIRHELEHSTQSLEKLSGAAAAGQEMMRGSPREVWRSPKTLGNYLMSEAEIEAWVAGMHHKARRTRTPFIKVVDDTVEHLMRETTKMGGQAVEMRNLLMTVRWKWIEYAKKRFPKAQVA